MEILILFLINKNNLMKKLTKKLTNRSHKFSGGMSTTAKVLLGCGIGVIVIIIIVIVVVATTGDTKPDEGSGDDTGDHSNSV